jgi:hypothetical protein
MSGPVKVLPARLLIFFFLLRGSKLLRAVKTTGDVEGCCDGGSD